MSDLNTKKSLPDLRDVLDATKREIYLDFKCHDVATIQEFDASNQTAKATINYKKSFTRTDAQGVTSTVQESYPILIDCPVAVLYGGKARITFPIAKGDSCLVFYNDRDINAWFASGQVAPLESNRLHSISDAILLVGLKPSTGSISDYSTDRAEIWNDELNVSLGASKLKVENSTRSLKDILTDLIGHVKDLADQCKVLSVTGVVGGGSLSGPPSNAVAINLISVQLSQDATKLGEILE